MTDGSARTAGDVAMALVGTVLGAWRESGRAERVAYATGTLLMASGLFHLGVFAVDGGPWSGPVSWRKPATFGLSFGLTAVTLTCVSTKVRLSRRGRSVLLWALSLATIVEVGLVTMQRWRGVPSHFNGTTAFDGAVFAAMGLSVAVIVAVILALTVQALRAPAADRTTAIAIRVGLLLLVGAQVIGGAMIAQGLGADPPESYAAGGALKTAHAAAMHGVQVLPGLSWLAALGVRSPARRHGLIRLGVLGYVAIAAVALYEVTAAAPASAVGLPSSVLLVAGLTALLAAFGIALAETFRSTTDRSGVRPARR